MSNLSDNSSSLFSGNAAYIEMLYEKWLKNPGSVDVSWQNLFSQAKNGAGAVTRPSFSHNIPAFEDELVAPKAAPADKKKGDGKAVAKSSDADVPNVEQATRDSLSALMLIRNYRVRGHLMAQYDPLEIEKPQYHPELDPARYGFEEKDFDRKIFLDGVLGLKFGTMREILDILRATYCGTMGVEFMHIQYPDQKSWIQKKIESNRTSPNLSAEVKKSILRTLSEVQSFEEFLQLKYASTKRFSIQGGDAAIAGLEAVLITAAALGVEEINIGMPHRGRMNVITTVMGKPYTELLSLFAGNLDFPEGLDTSGDVKYHLGVSSDRQFADGRKMHLSLASNPSHLEIVNPVVVGKVRAKQDQRADTTEGGKGQGHGGAHARRRGVRGAGLGGRNPVVCRAARLPHRRHGAYHRQQPDRFHHLAEILALHAIPVRCCQNDPGADFPRQRRRSGGGLLRL